MAQMLGWFGGCCGLVVVVWFGATLQKRPPVGRLGRCPSVTGKEISNLNVFPHLFYECRIGLPMRQCEFIWESLSLIPQSMPIQYFDIIVALIKSLNNNIASK
jgi:hypothetical protein